MPTAIVVDDTAADRLLAETLLKHAGYTVTVCSDGQIGLELIERQTPELIVVDVVTPGIDGYDLARAVRGNPVTASTPIILQTAHYLEEDVRRLAAQIGVAHVIIKPFEPQEFLNTVARARKYKPAPKRTAGAGVEPAFNHEHMRMVSAKLHEKVQELEAARGEFQATASGYRLLFRVHPEPMWVFNVETLRFLEVNDAALRRYGYSRDEFLAMTIKDIHRPEDVPAFLENLHTDADLTQPSSEFHRMKDGAVIEVQISTRDIGHGSRYVMAQDVTEKKKYQQQVQQAQRMDCLLYTSPSPRDRTRSRMPSSA